MATTSHLGLTLVEQSQAQKEVTVNQALTRIDAVLNTGAISRTINTPPGSPSSGDLYIIGASPTGDWAGHAGELAYYDQIWRFITQGEGMTLWVNDEDAIYSYDGSAWTAITGGQAGFSNKFRNAAFDIWQRGTSGTITAGTPAYTADGWIVGSSGANVTWAQAAGKALSAYSLKITGATSVSATTIKQRIESFLCYTLAGQTLTFQAQIYNNTGSAITPTLTVKRANAADNWSATTTEVSAQNLQSCADGAWTRVSYSFSVSSSAGNGLEISIDFGASLNGGGKYVQITEADLRASYTVTSPELRPVAVEITLNKRYYRRLGGVTNFPVGAGTIFTGMVAHIVHAYEDEMRAPPTITNSGATIIGINVSGTTQVSTAINWTVSTAKNAYATISVAIMLTQGDGCTAQISNSSQYIEFSSEL